MGSDKAENLPAFHRAGKWGWPIGGRATPAEVELIDRASEKLGMKRAHFVVRSAIERAERVIGTIRPSTTARTLEDRRDGADRRVPRRPRRVSERNEGPDAA